MVLINNYNLSYVEIIIQNNVLEFLCCILERLECYNL